MDAHNEPGFIILAAGWSKRFGANKLEAKLENGKFVLQKTCSDIQSVCKKSLLVVNEEVCFSHCDLENLHIDILRIRSQGLGSSIAQAVHHTSAWNGWILCLADMPFIKLYTFQEMRKKIATNPDNIIRTCYQGKPGHPVYFPKRFFQDLSMLKDDVGAMNVIAQYSDKLELLDVDDAGVVYDIDIPRDLNTTLK